MKTIFSNSSNKRRFTQELAEMVCEKRFDLPDALNILSKNPGKLNKQISFAAKDIYENLMKGLTCSDALRLCPYIEFDTVYISFVRFAERCGSLEKTLKFLKEKSTREEMNMNKIIQASIYPLFVVVLAVAGGVFLYFYFAATFEEIQNGAINSNLYSSLILAFSFLILFCMTAFFFLKKTLGINKLYEAFLAMGFLIKGGESLANAVSDAVIILGYDSKEGRLFADAGKKLSYGIGLKDSFSLEMWRSSVRSELEEAFFYAEKTGGENDVFEKIALQLYVRDEKRRALCFRLIEPFFILGTGIFLMIFLMNLVIPLFTQTSMFL